jgi:cyclase
MLYTRVIPVLLFDDGGIYRSQQFSRHYRLGDPLSQIERYKAWDVDEIVYLDMHRTGRPRLIDFLPQIAKNCFAPLAVGGAIRTLEDIHRHLNAGADRIVIGTAAFDNPTFISEAAHRYGAQAIIVSIDARATSNDQYEVAVESGQRPTGRRPEDWAQEAAEHGAGEILVTSIDREGMGLGYDLNLIRRVSSAVNIPVIACGGAGQYAHFAPAIREGGAAAIAAANIFAFKEISYLDAKDALMEAGVSVRKSTPNERKRYAVKELELNALLSI